MNIKTELEPKVGYYLIHKYKGKKLISSHYVLDYERFP